MLKLSRTAAFLVIGFAASVFIFFASHFAVHYDGDQPIGKNFQSLLHDAYGAYINATRTNYTSLNSPYAFGGQDFTNNSQNWQLPTHASFADFTSDISLDHLLKMFSGTSEDTKTSTSMNTPRFEKVFRDKQQESRHPAAPLNDFDPAHAEQIDQIDQNMKCSKSFEPTCDMYSYVRFWNQRFYPEDCYESPLRPVTREQTPYDQQKYVVFEPDWGGWNNIRMAAETVMIFAHATGRTLVLPPNMKFYLLNKNPTEVENQSTFDKFFDFRKIKEGMNIITMEDFVENVAKKGLMGKEPFPNIKTSQKTKLYDYIERNSYMRAWEPGKWFIGFNLSTQNDNIFGTFELNKRKQTRYKEMVAHGRTLVPYDANMNAHRVIYFYGRYDTHRMLTHFYTYLYWEDPHIEQIYKRIVRDRLHYHDDIFCGAGRVVQRIHQEASRLTGLPLPSPAAASPKTLGGDTNRDATYFAYHIRRGDFQYKETRLSAEQIWNNTKHLLNSSITTLIYIATDEKDHKFFAPFMRPPWKVKFLSDFTDAITSPSTTTTATTTTSQVVAGTSSSTGGVNMNHVGMIEQVVCANAHTFFGTPRSTFTGYITRMRGKTSL